ncbi:15218_t:CDS:2 [Funneliformis geosporum]|nr:15218_t:CDS:2 [Funneliformis geosporum]
MTYGTYYQISRKHSQRYLDEFTLRFNTREHKAEERFDLVLLATVFSGIGAFEQALNKLNIKHQILFACDNDRFVNEKARLNCLLKSKLYAELAKEKMEEYRKLTVEDYNKDKNENPLIVFEIKDKGKDLKKALGVQAQWSTLKEKWARKELVRLFSSANKELRKAGLESGVERFGEFCNLLFLKLLSEEEEKREKLGQSRIEFQVIYDKDIFSSLKIENHTILETIISRLNDLSLTTVNFDTLGETFEYFLKAYLANQKKDLGQYFTPRHLVNFLVELANPRLGEEIYDPFCGTGGILIQAYKHAKT